MVNEEAIKELKILREEYWDDDGYGHETKQYNDTMFALDLAIKALEQTRWIPVSEKLPEDGQKVWVTIRSGDIIDVDAYIFHHASVYWKHCVIAWMPQPESYNEENKTKQGLAYAERREKKHGKN